MGFSRKGAGLVAVTALAASTLTLVPPASGAATTTQSSSAAGASAVTNYGFFGQAFGSRVRGGDLQANSGRTALAFIGCTRQTGRTDTNSLVTANLGIATANGIDSRTRTYRRGGSVNVKSTNEIADVTFTNGAGPLDDVVLTGIRSVARAWHDANGFHSSGRTSVAGVTLGGVTQTPVNGVIDIPGVLTITLADKQASRSRDGASMTVRAAVVDLALSNTKVTLGVASARIQDGFVTGVLGGVGIAARGSVLRDVVRTGEVARQPLPCRGTNGNWRTNKTLGVTLQNVLHLGAATGSARGDQIDRRHGYAQTRGRVARATFGSDNGLVIKGVVGAANVTKDGSRLVKTAKGTHILSITFNGRDRRSPTFGNPVRIGNLAVLSAPRVKRSKFGISVIALRVELLRGTNTIVDLGLARASIKPR
ncbi:MAG: hypothetical protein H0V23_07250 [Nocardioidaceae bacterium]|nr:hypothetical protein [Nocardioidaceae bacterium]